MELVGRADPLLETSPARMSCPDADVVVDFTRPDTALGNALACVRAGVHVVIGTTGFDPTPCARRTPSAGRPAANVLIAPELRDRRGPDDALRRRRPPST